MDNTTMKSVLWSQGVSVADPGYLVIDGKSSRYSGSSEQENAMAMMNNMSLTLVRKHMDGDGTSPSFVVKKDMQWLYVEGNFHEKDCANRLRVFRYLIHSQKPDEVVSTLEDSTREIGCTLYQKDKDIIHDICNKLSNSFHKIIQTCVIILFSTTIICLLWCALAQ